MKHRVVRAELVIAAAAFLIATGFLVGRVGSNSTSIEQTSDKVAHLSDIQGLRAAVALDRAHDNCVNLNETRRELRSLVALAEARLREQLRVNAVQHSPGYGRYKAFIAGQIRQYDVVYENLAPKPCPAGSLERTALASYTPVFSPIIPPPYRTLGGARCQAQQPKPRGGVICFVPGHPWAVGITRQLVIVWRGTDKQFVRSNK